MNKTQSTSLLCPKCKMAGGINRVQEAAIRGGPYWGCVYCGSVFEDVGPNTSLPGKMPTETTATGSREKYAKY